MIDGELVEYRSDRAGAATTSGRQLLSGDSTFGTPTLVHELVNRSGAEATTLHVYSPARGPLAGWEQDGGRRRAGPGRRSYATSPAGGTAAGPGRRVRPLLYRPPGPPDAPTVRRAVLRRPIDDVTTLRANPPLARSVVHRTGTTLGAPRN
jgi:hypothetical protein